jgi:hypothetical protein
MKAFKRILLGLSIGFSSRALWAAELSPFLREPHIGVTLTSLKMPETFAKDLMSGLTNRILLRINVKLDDKIVAERFVEIGIKYDLWDEQFRLNAHGGTPLTLARSFNGRSELMSFLSSIRIVDLIEAQRVTVTTPLVFEAAVLFNPIEKERMEKIQKWVAQNSTSTTMSTNADGSMRIVGGIRQNAVFNKIFEEFTMGASVVAASKDFATSKPIRLSELPREK